MQEATNFEEQKNAFFSSERLNASMSDDEGNMPLQQRCVFEVLSGLNTVEADLQATAEMIHTMRTSEPNDGGASETPPPGHTVVVLPASIRSLREKHSEQEGGAVLTA